MCSKSVGINLNDLADVHNLRSPQTIRPAQTSLTRAAPCLMSLCSTSCRRYILHPAKMLDKQTKTFLCPCCHRSFKQVID